MSRDDGKEPLNSSIRDEMLLQTCYYPHCLSFKSRQMAQCVSRNLWEQWEKLIWCWVPSSTALVTIFVELIFSIRPFFGQTGLLVATQIGHVDLILGTSAHKIPGARYLSFLTLSPSVHIKLILQGPAILFSTEMTLFWHFIIYSKNGKYVQYNLLHMPHSQENITKWYGCSLSPRLSRTLGFFST